jgi:hypothetical protein
MIGFVVVEDSANSKRGSKGLGLTSINMLNETMRVSLV